ncbi:hypothetical protein C7S16_3138 [Burkholderia thailandensis]|uniref:Uncharacterized protein n=1 Tax=Burkholderia thailandensis TaxID=57975 RepID=A0AAW9D208_BURTH|nr:hypothetical protein [Burkholderia thailandensis]
MRRRAAAVQAQAGIAAGPGMPAGIAARARLLARRAPGFAG